MWRLLPLILLVACAASDPGQVATEGDPEKQFRITSSLEIPLQVVGVSATGQAQVKRFQQGDTLGEINASGLWNVRHLVNHSRFRCASYQTGVQFGRGNPSCTAVKWLTDIDYGSSRTHCNNAPIVHRVEGKFSREGIFDQATCVQIVTRCQGPC